MTDAVIIKALEDHYKQVDAGYSTHLEYGGNGDEHEEKYIYMLREALDLINRQKAEIERLEAKCENTQVGYNIARAETEEYKAINKSLKADRPFLIANAKAEAIKEFAERLEANFEVSSAYSFGYIACQIDNLVKEMVGDTE